MKVYDTDDSKGLVLLEMSTRSEAEKAIGMLNGFNLNDRELKVSLAVLVKTEPTGLTSGAGVSAANASD